MPNNQRLIAGVWTVLSNVLKTRFERAMFGVVVALSCANLAAGACAVYTREEINHEPQAASACVILHIDCKA